MKKVELEIVALSHSVSHSHNYAVVLGEDGGVRRLPIVIGAFEAQAIAVAMEQMTPSRPLTHDLMKNLLEAYDVVLKEVIVNNLMDGVFYAVLVCDRDGEVIEIDSRTSDALAMAVRFNCPIYTYEFILDQAGVVLENTGTVEEPVEVEKSEEAADPENPLAHYSLDELQKLLDEVLQKEDYEQAANIRDEISKRS